MKYWRTILCASALGACGLGVWADDCVRGKSSKKVATLAASAELAPVPISAAEPPLKVIMDVGGPAPLPSAPAVVPPPAIPTISDPLVQKVGASNPEPASPKLALPSDPPPLPVKNLELPPAPTGLEPPPAIPHASPTVPPKQDTPKPSLELPKAPLPIESPKSPAPASEPPIDLPSAPAAATPKLDFPSPPPLRPSLAAAPAAPIAPAVSVPQSAEPPVASAPASGPFKMFLRMGGSAQPRFEVKDGDAMILKVYFDHVDLHAGNQGLTAKGNVRMHGSGLDGTCDQLSLSSTKGEVELKGNIRLNCYRGGASTLITADQMKFQLKGASDPAKSHKTGTVPASWSGKR